MRETTMTMRGCLVVLAFVVHALSSPVGGAASLNEQSAGVSISEGTAAPEAEVVLPAYLAAPDGVPVGTVTIRLGFPKALLTFIRVEPSGLVTGINGDVRSTVKEGSTPDQSVVETIISTLTPGSSREPLPLGPRALCYFVFKISKNADLKPIELVHEASASTTDDPPKPVAPVATSKAIINVAKPAVAACFFYMH